MSHESRFTIHHSVWRYHIPPPECDTDDRDQSTERSANYFCALVVECLAQSRANLTSDHPTDRARQYR